MAKLQLRPVLEALTPGQAVFLDAMRTSDITICDGPWGTGKTHASVGYAARDVLDKQSKRDKIIVVRPAVEAGEKLGFLPGVLEEKVAPYMAPIFNSFKSFCRNTEEYEDAIKSKTIEIIPLAFLQGHSLKNCWMILDESQNATRAQLEMFLTRMDRNTRVIMVGSKMQCFLPEGPVAWNFIFDRLSGGGFRKGKVSCVTLGKQDIVRHDLIAEVMTRLMSEEPEDTVEEEEIEEEIFEDDEDLDPLTYWDVFVKGNKPE